MKLRVSTCTNMFSKYHSERLTRGSDIYLHQFRCISEQRCVDDHLTPLAISGFSTSLLWQCHIRMWSNRITDFLFAASQCSHNLISEDSFPILEQWRTDSLTALHLIFLGIFERIGDALTGIWAFYSDWWLLPYESIYICYMLRILYVLLISFDYYWLIWL
jgi:hypothetical protein